MAVTFTPNLGLAKPDKNELADNWIDGPELYEDNILIIQDKMEIDQNIWSPLVIGPTTNPSLGTTLTNKSEYQEMNGIIFGTVTIEAAGSGITSGTGTGAYGFACPVNADNTFHTIGSALNDASGIASVVGEGYFNDADTIANCGAVAVDIVRIGGIDYFRLLTEVYTGKTQVWVGPSIPAALATGDRFTFNFMYKKA